MKFKDIPVLGIMLLAAICIAIAGIIFYALQEDSHPALQTYEKGQLVLDDCNRQQVFNACMSIKDSNPDMCQFIAINQSLTPVERVPQQCIFEHRK